jgi:hypothetical protein
MGLIWTNVLHGGYPQESGRYYVKILSYPLFKIGDEVYRPKLFTAIEQYYTEADAPNGAGFYMTVSLDDEHNYIDRWGDGVIIYWAKVDDEIELTREDAEALYKKYFSHKKEGDSNGGI